jgi:hypothetical protein
MHIMIKIDAVIEDVSTYSSHVCVTIGGRKCFLDTLTKIRINGLLLDLEKGNTTETAMKKLSKIFNRDRLKDISCISLTTMPVAIWEREYVKEINLDVPEHLRIGAFGMFKLCASYPENYYIFKEEPSARIHLNTGKLYFYNKETMEYTLFGGVADMTPLGIKNIVRNEETMVEETTMIHKRKSLGIKNIIFNAPATIVFWDDNTKTVVKCSEGDVFDPEKGVAMAVMKRALGTNETDSNYLDKVKKYLDKYREEETTVLPDIVATISETIGQKLKDARVRRLKNEAMNIRDAMLTGGASHWELETFDRFCRKYIVDKEATNGKKE